MSEWAKVDAYPEERTAYEYRELYLDDGTEFGEFFCPYCGVPLIPVNIFTSGEMALSPHFRINKGTPHRFDCNGSPIESVTGEKRQRTHPVEKSTFYLPEKLVPRRKSVVTRVGRESHNEVPDNAEIDRRRRDAGRRLGPAIYQTSLVRSIAMAFLGVFKESYKQQKQHKWSEDCRKQWVANILQNSPLTLYGRGPLTYKTALRNTRFPPEPDPFIFHGWASANCIHEHDQRTYCLSPKIKVEDRGGNHIPVEIIITIPDEISLTESQKNTVRMLDKAANENSEIRWFCYGQLILCEDKVYRMRVYDIDHIYLHTIKQTNYQISG
ncbi:hypothetical protein HFQ13_09405 [Acidithiobacillus sp. VAN18-1]|uniref:Uncharacterized protein n=1 Tax=Igneacidithiobacillus copahuensis TaxID=2724909 RepID=A0AAE2YQP7_9PROT|nr:hypothetical protein [Igneacidithiobacillus copahuensis]MBU2788412.1 hypothetical protein [Igneacidithiobacillus copahuensis]MBU2796919.1 hypothetical protein [Acidithiobacillus sp. VAN18-2]